jgi:hypothetical protein
MSLLVIDRADVAERLVSTLAVSTTEAPVSQVPDQLLRVVHGFGLVIEAQ